MICGDFRLFSPISQQLQIKVKQNMEKFGKVSKLFWFKCQSFQNDLLFYFEGFTSIPTALTANDRNRRIQVYQAILHSDE